MKKRLIEFVTLVVLALFVIPVIATPTLSQRFDADGYYFVQGRAPKGFENIERITVFLNAKKSDRMPVSGLNTKRGPVFRFADQQVTGKVFTFTTAAVRGTSYRFDGHFLRSDPTEGDADEPVLEGVLSKYAGGRKIAETTLRFTYSTGG